MNRFLACVLFFVVAGLVAATPLRAATLPMSWIGATGDFTVSSNWDLGIPPPLPGVDTYYPDISNGGTAILNTTYGTPPTSQPLRLYVGGNYGGSTTPKSGTFEIQSGGALQVDRLYLGNETVSTGKVAAALGKLVMTGGTLTVATQLRIAGASQSIVDLSGDAALTVQGTADAYVGGGYSFVSDAATNQTGVIKLSGTSIFQQTSNNIFFGWGSSTAVNSGYLSLQSGTTFTSGTTGTSNFITVGYSPNATSPGTGVIDQFGGTFTAGNRGIRMANGTGSWGVYNMFGGTSTPSAPDGVYQFNVGYQGGGTGIVNVSGTAHMTSAITFIGVRSAGGVSTGILNLGAVGSTNDASIFTANVIGQYEVASKGYLNFHGGLLQANIDTTSFLANTNPIDGIYVYGEGARIDTNGHNITIAANSPMLAPSGSGVTSIPVTAKGSGYSGAPVVQITGGGGTGATAYAVMDGDKVDSIVISNPGVDYTSTPTVTLVGGGGSGVTLGALSLASNSSGGLTKSGTGTLTLDAANTYTGMTTVNEGTLKIAAPAALTGSATINANATLSIATTMTLSGQIFGTAGTLSIDSGAPTLAANAYSGTVALNGGNLNLSATHPGTLYVNNGFSWYHNGAGSVAGTTTVGSSISATSQDALLGGAGTLGNVTVLNSYGNSPGVKGGLEAGQNGIGSLHVANLTFNGGGFAYIGNATQGIGAYTGSNAAIIAGGTLTVGAETAGTVQFDLGGANVASGTYHLIQHNGAINYLNGSALSNFQVANAVLSARQTASFADNAGAGSTRYLDYVVVGFYPVWTGLIGAATDDTWYQNDTAKKNWKANTDSTPLSFIDGNVPTSGVGDAVLFSDAGAGHTTVAIPLNVAPVTVTVDSALDYAFTTNAGAGIVDSTFATAPKTLLIKKNSGMLTISTPNTYSGGTTVVDGTIRVGNATALGAGPVGFFPGAASTARVQVNGYNVAVSGLSTDALTPGSPVVENGSASAAALTINNAADNTYAGLLQDGGAGSLAVTFAGSAPFTLAAVNTYSGDTTLSAYGNLKIGIDNALPHGAGKGNVVFDGGALDMNGRNQTVNGLSNTAAVATITNTAAATTGTLTVGDNDASSSVFASILDNGTGKVALAKIGVGTLTLNNPADIYGLPSTYSGGTTLTTGIIQTGYNAALGTGSLDMAAATTLDLRSAALNIGALSGDGLITTTMVGNGAVLTVNSPAAANTSFVGSIDNGSGTLGLTKTGNGTLALGSANTYTGVTKLSQTGSTTTSTLIVPVLANGGETSSIGASSADPANLSFNGGALKYTGSVPVTTDRGFYIDYNWTTIDTEKDLTFTGLVASTEAHGALTKAGLGALSLTNVNNNPFFYQLQVRQGVLNLVGDATTAPTYKNQYDVNIGYNGMNAVLNLTHANLLMTDTTGSNGTIRLGYENDSYAYLPIKDGVSVTNTTDGSRIYVGLPNGSAGVVDQTGGTLIMGSLIALGGDTSGTGNGWGVWNMTGGTAELNTRQTNGLRIGNDANGVGIMTVSGAAHLTTHTRIYLGTYSTASCTGILNLGAVGSTTDTSVVSAPDLGRYTTTGTTGLLNFHGGTLQAIADSTAFLSSPNPVSATYIYGEGAEIDTQEFNITIGVPLSKPTGQGVASIPVTAGGSGYIGPPVVKILGGGGVGATAYAVMAGDQVDHIVISNPGTGYTSEPTIVLQGGGGTGTTLGTLGYVDNDASNGGLTKLGAGTLTLNGALSYTGNTTVAAGTLNANTGINTPTATVWVPGGSTLNATSLAANALTIGGAYAAAAAVPEPGAWLMIIAGLLALGIARRLIRRG
ncbi:MAG: autotransporter-associated beta strand repeat-containing protein [Pirellulales bacterium]|nr:autotransporter-associated beta strand repeat-containing protein [Pirellulales bacterium]